MPKLPKPGSRLARHTRALSALLLILIAGCAPLQEQAKPTANITPNSWPAHQVAMQALQHWQLKGKLAYRNDQDSGSAWFDWTQRGDSFKMYLSGPFGVGTVTISGDSQTVTLSQPGRDDISAASATALTRRLFGAPLPVEQLRYWVKGIPASTSASLGFNAKGLLTSLEKNDWNLRIGRYTGDIRGPLPGKITGRSDNLTFTLLLKDWSFPDDTPNPSFDR